MLPKQPCYNSILQRLHFGDTFLDVGCFIGQDLRRLVFDGAPSSHLYGVDIVNHWDLGYEFFKDRDRFSATYLEADVMSPNSGLTALRGKIDIINITHVLHQWDWRQQVACAKQLVDLSSGPGASVVGFQVGSVGERDKRATEEARGDSYWHSVESFASMWDTVGKETDTVWDIVDGALLRWGDVGWEDKDVEYLGEDARVLRFEFKRME